MRLGSPVRTLSSTSSRVAGRPSRHHVVRSGEVIRADDPGLYEAAALLGLGIEDDHGRRYP